MSLKLGALSALAADTDHAARMVVLDADTQMPLMADGRECYIEFLSIDSDVGRGLAKQRSVAQVRRIRSGRNQLDDEDFFQQQIDTVTALALDWYFGPDADPFSREAARTLFADKAYAWLTRQAFGFVSAEANFMTRSSTNSSRSASMSSVSAPSEATEAPSPIT